MNKYGLKTEMALIELDEMDRKSHAFANIIGLTANSEQNYRKVGRKLADSVYNSIQSARDMRNGNYEVGCGNIDVLVNIMKGIDPKRYNHANWVIEWGSFLDDAAEKIGAAVIDDEQFTVDEAIKLYEKYYLPHAKQEDEKMDMDSMHKETLSE